MLWDEIKARTPFKFWIIKMVPVPEAMPENGKWLKIAKKFKVRETERETGRFGTPGKSGLQGVS